MTWSASYFVRKIRWPTTLTVQTSEINNLKLTSRQNTQNSRHGKKNTKLFVPTRNIVLWPSLMSPANREVCPYRLLFFLYFSGIKEHLVYLHLILENKQAPISMVDNNDKIINEIIQIFTKYDLSTNLSSYWLRCFLTSWHWLLWSIDRAEMKIPIV